MRNRLLEPRKSGRGSRTSHAHVVDELGRQIISGVLAVGSLLPGDAELAQRFKVSRTVLRETMKTLAAKGLIVPRARVGTRVTEKNHWNMFDSDVINWHFEGGANEEFLLHLYDIRLAFEPFAAGLVAERATDADIAQLRQLAQAMGDPTLTTDSLVLADLEFHLAIAEFSRNPFMRTVGSLIEAALVGMFKMSSPPSSDQHALGDVSQTHLRIVDAISARDAAAARKAMDNVIIVGRNHIKDSFSRNVA